MSEFFRLDPNQDEKPKRVIAIKPIYTGHEEKAAAPDPDFSEERSAVLEQANRQAKQLIEQAENEKNRIMKEAEDWQEDWQREKERIQTEAYEQAFAKGLTEGRESGYQEMSGLIAEANSIVESSKVEYEKNVERSEQTILELALLCAEKILQQELQKDHELFMGVVRAAIKEVRDQKEVQIHVHPGRYKLVVSQKDEIEALFPSGVNSYIFPNEEAEENACFIETANGRVDASIDTQLQQMRKTLFDLLERE